MLPFYSDDNCIIYNDDCLSIMPLLWTGGYEEFDLLFLDAPFQIYKDFQKEDFPETKTVVAFTNSSNVHYLYELFGKPRFELIWKMGNRNARCTPHYGPLTVHETILVWGETGEAYVGEYNTDRTPRKIGSNIRSGEGRLSGHKIYTPRERKMIYSVLDYPQDGGNASNGMGRMGKPLKLMEILLEWVNPKTILDPFMGSVTTLEASRNLGMHTIGIEKELDYCELAKTRLAQQRLEI